MLIAAAIGISGGLASIISFAKFQNTSAYIGRIGEEAGSVRVTFFISLAFTAVGALLSII